MGKFRLEGDVNLGFDVEDGLNEEFVLKVHTIPVEVNGKSYKVLVGEGDISYIPEETLSVSIKKFYSLLQRDKSLVELNFLYLLGIEVRGYDKKVLGEGDEILKGLIGNELGNWMLTAYNLLDFSGLRKTIAQNLFPISCEAMWLFWEIKDYKQSLFINSQNLLNSLTQKPPSQAKLSPPLPQPVCPRCPVWRLEDI
jgi:hypothetical protein